MATETQSKGILLVKLSCVMKERRTAITVINYGKLSIIRGADAYRR